MSPHPPPWHDEHNPDGNGVHRLTEAIKAEGHLVIDSLPAERPDIEHAKVMCSSLLPQFPDTRDRTAVEYLVWEEKLADDIAARGIQNPIHVLRTPDGLRVLLGETRRRGKIRRGDGPVPVIIHNKPMSEEEVDLAQDRDDEFRRPRTAAEKVERWLGYKRKYGWTQALIARKVGVEQPTISKALHWFEAFPEDLREKIGRGDGNGSYMIPVTGAAEIARLKTPEAIREMAEMALACTMKRDTIVREVRKRLGLGKGRAKPMKIKWGGVKLEITGNPAAELTALRGKIDEVLKVKEKQCLPDSVLQELFR